MAKQEKQRTTAGLRDILFDEIESLRAEGGDPLRARAVATLAHQICGTARLEMQFQETMVRLQNQGANVNLGGLALGSK